MAIDTVVANSLISAQKEGGPNASILYEVSHQAGNEGHQKHNHEKWQTSNPGRVPGVRNQNVQDWKELELALQHSGLLKGLGIHVRVASPFIAD